MGLSAKENVEDRLEISAIQTSNSNFGIHLKTMVIAKLVNNFLKQEEKGIWNNFLMLQQSLVSLTKQGEVGLPSNQFRLQDNNQVRKVGYAIILKTRTPKPIHRLGSCTI
jgi:hypothetical protein